MSHFVYEFQRFVINALNEALSHLQRTPPAPPQPTRLTSTTPKQTLQALLCFSEGQHRIKSAFLYTDKGCSQLDGQFYPSAINYAVTEWSAFYPGFSF